jgi:hypothetical protein
MVVFLKVFVLFGKLVKGLTPCLLLVKKRERSESRKEEGKQQPETLFFCHHQSQQGRNAQAAAWRVQQTKSLSFFLSSGTRSRGMIS